MIQFFLAALETDADRIHFTNIYNQYEPEMRKYARHLLGSDDGLEDALQEAFVKVIRAFDDCRKKEGVQLRNWLLTIVKNVIRDMKRAQKRYNGIHHSLPDMHCEDDHEALESLTAAEMMNARIHPQDEVLAQMQHQYLVKRILTMPDIYCEILEKSLLLGMSNREIAGSMCISENTVATRLRRGRELLIKELEKEGITYDRA